MKKIISLCILLLTAISASAQYPASVHVENLERVDYFDPGKSPAFIGGEAALTKYFSDGIIPGNYNVKGGDSIKISVGFVVDTAGRVCNIFRVATLPLTADTAIGHTVMHLFDRMPAWSPGLFIHQNDTHAVNVHLYLDVVIRKNKTAGNVSVEARVRPLPKGIIESNSDNNVFSFAEEMPKPDYDFNAYLSKYTKYPYMARNANKQGTVYVRFVVDRDGSIVNVMVIKSVYNAPDLDQEAARVVAEMPKWNSAKMNGHPVRVEVVQPVRFVLR